MSAPGPMRVSPAPNTAHPEDAQVVVSPDDAHEARVDARTQVGRSGPMDRAGRHPVEVVVDGWRFEFLVEDEARAALRDRATRGRGAAGTTDGPLEIHAIIPGRILDVAVVAGDTVEAGQTLLAVEAMKMQNELRAPRAGTVTRVAVAAGTTVELGDLLVVLG